MMMQMRGGGTGQTDPGTTGSKLAYSDCRRAARSMCAAERGREAYNTIRPRGVSGLFRSRAPVPIILFLAAREGRLVWRSTDEFAILQPPAGRTWLGGGGPVLAVLRLIDRYWDVLILLLPNLFLLGCAALVGAVTSVPRPPSAVALALILVLLALVYTAVMLTAGAMTGVRWFWRQFAGRSIVADENAASREASSSWSMPLCHQAHEQRCEEILRRSRQRLDHLIGVRIGAVVAELGGRPDAVPVAETLVCQVAGATTDMMRECIRRMTVSPPGGSASSPVTFYLSPDRPSKATNRLFERGGFIFLYAFGVATTVAVCAEFVATWERSACGAAVCSRRPTTYLRALHWLSQRLLLSDPAGLSPATTRAWSLGWLTSLMALTGVVVAVAAGYRYVVFNGRRSAIFHRALNHPPTRVLIMVATPVERDAVRAAVHAVNEMSPRLTFDGAQTIHHLGAISNAEITLAQSEPGSVNPGSAGGTASDLIARLRPDYLVLTGICFGLRPGEQKLGDVLVCRQLMAVDYRKVVDGPDGNDSIEINRSDRVVPSVTLLGRFNAMEATWRKVRVHFGPMLSGNVLVSSREYRDRLVKAAPDAYGGEMEGAGVYAVAAPAKVDWIVVKGISDWGFDKTDEAQGRAAANAAEFVVYTIAQGALDKQPVSGAS